MTTRTRVARMRSPHIRQAEESDCGVACLASILAFHGRHVPWHELQRVCGGGRDGLSAARLLTVGGQFGLIGGGKRVALGGDDRTDRQTLAGLAAPAIVHLNGSHFAVLDGITRRGQVAVNDPASGPRVESVARFRANFTGLALTLTPGADFTPGGESAPERRTVREWLRPQAVALVCAVVAGLSVAALGVAAAFVVRHLITHSASGNAPDLASVGLRLGLVAGGTLVLAWAQARLLSRTLLAMSVRRSRELVTHLLTLPGSFFHRRFVGGVAARAQLADSIATQLSAIAVTTSTSAVTMLGLLGVMVWLAPWPAAVAAGGTLVSALLVRVACRRDSARQAGLAAEQAGRDGETMAGLAMVETLKAEGHAAALFERWARSHARSLDGTHRSARTHQRTLALVTSLDTVVFAGVITVGALQVSHRALPIGDLIAVLTLTGVFSAQSAILARSGLQTEQLRSSLTQYADVADAPAQRRYASGIEHHQSWRVADASLELHDVRFGYDTARPPLLDGIALRVAPGERVILVGRSGGGKSSVAKLLVGALEPWSGQVRLSGIPLGALARTAVVATLGYVPQKPWLIEGSVADNVGLGDRGVTAAMIRDALELACVDTVVRRRGGIDRAFVQQGGGNFSGGERQRIALARALVRMPSVLVLDEATSALEESLARVVDAQLRQHVHTLVCVAHRLDTLERSDRVIRVHEGRLEPCPDGVPAVPRVEAVTVAGRHARLEGAAS